MAKDYYEILGVSRGANDEQIKRAYRKLAQQYHPDKQGGNEKKFKEINEAYQVLSDAQKRAQYDRFGTTFEQAQAQGGFGGFNGFRDFSGFAEAFSGGEGFSARGGSAFGGDFGNLGDIFSDIFGGQTASRARRGERRGADIGMEIEISLEEAFAGAEKEIKVYKAVQCQHCKGKGGEPGSKTETCSNCKGKGNVSHTRQAAFFSFTSTETCPVCRGTGKKPSKLCSRCGGDGRINEQARLKVKIPAGIENGQIIKLSGQGQAAELGGQAGDLYITIHIRKHQYFNRKGNDIYYDLFIHIAQAALGDKIEIPTLEGRINLKIPAGIDSGEIIRLKNKGMPRFGGWGRGDMMVIVHVKTPKKMSRKARKLMEEIKEEL